MKLRIFIYVLFLFLALLSSSFALLASPASHNIPFGASSDSWSVSVTNDESQSLSITFEPTGPLAPIITVPAETALAPGEKHLFTFSVASPPPTQPGTLESGVIIEANPLNGGTVSATTAVLHIIRLVTPEDGVYISGEILSNAASAGNPSIITLSLQSIGTLPAQGDVSISVGDLATRTQNFLIPPKSSANILLPWTPPHAGDYPITASVKYANKSLDLHSEIIVGNLSVRITSIDWSDFRLGQPFRVSANVTNDWGDTLPVVAKVSVKQLDDKGGSIEQQTGSSTTVQVGSLAHESIPVFVESNNMHPGDATIGVTVEYANKQTSMEIPVIVGVDSLDRVTSNTSAPAANSHTILIVIFAIVIIIIIFGAWFFFKRKKPQEPEQNN